LLARYDRSLVPTLLSFSVKVLVLVGTGGCLSLSELFPRPPFALPKGTLGPPKVSPPLAGNRKHSLLHSSHRPLHLTLSEGVEQLRLLTVRLQRKVENPVLLKGTTSEDANNSVSLKGTASEDAKNSVLLKGTGLEDANNSVLLKGTASAVEARNLLFLARTEPVFALPHPEGSVYLPFLAQRATRRKQGPSGP
jgi:hypothetical protein